MDRLELFDRARLALQAAGFYVSDRVDVRPVSFDLVARRDQRLLFVKVLQNIDGLTARVASELRTLAGFLDGSALVLGERSGAGELTDGVVYVRHGVPIVTAKTLEDELATGEPPLVYAAPGGFYVNLDGARLAALRAERSLGLGALARAAGVSRRTIAMYEKGMSATVEAAARLEEFLDVPIILPTDPLAKAKRAAGEGPAQAPERAPLSPLEREVFRLLERMGYEVVPTGSSPLDALSRGLGNALLTGVTDTDARLLRKARIMSSVSRVVERPGFFIVRRTGTRTNLEGSPLVGRDELKRIREPEGVFELVREREKRREKERAG